MICSSRPWILASSASMSVMHLSLTTSTSSTSLSAFLTWYKFETLKHFLRQNHKWLFIRLFISWIAHLTNHKCSKNTAFLISLTMAMLSFNCWHKSSSPNFCCCCFSSNYVSFSARVLHLLTFSLWSESFPVFFSSWLFVRRLSSVRQHFTF